MGSAAAEISLGLWTEPTKTKKRYALHKFEDKTLNYYLALVLLGFFVVCLGFFFFFPRGCVKRVLPRGNSRRRLW